jgi:hypothetical protein
MYHSRPFHRGRVLVWPILCLTALAFPLAGGDCVSDNVGGAVDQIVQDVTDDVVAGQIEEATADAGANAAGFGDQGNDSSGYGTHVEDGGLVVVEAEHYTLAKPNSFEMLGQQVNFDNRRWYTQPGKQNGPSPDPDGYHAGASGSNYVECLPDSRVTHNDPIEDGSIYGDIVGGARLDYDIEFATAGTYWVWVRGYSSGTEDNGMHVSIDGVVPASGWKIQMCGQNVWKWTNAQRESGGSACGVNGTIMIEVATPGVHTISFHQREDGFEFDRFLMTVDPYYVPDGVGPAESFMMWLPE